MDASDDPDAPLENFNELDAAGYAIAADVSLETEQEGRYFMVEQQLFEKFRDLAEGLVRLKTQSTWCRADYGPCHACPSTLPPLWACTNETICKNCQSRGATLCTTTIWYSFVLILWWKKLFFLVQKHWLLI